MSGGNNWKFKFHKSTFLNDHPLTVGFMQANMPAVAGIYDFDIQTRFRRGGGYVLEVVGFNHRNKQDADCRTRRIRAYWLPWQSRATVDYDLTDEADYFFTSELNGCQFRAARTGPNVVRAIHVAGDSQGAATQAGSQWRNQQAEARLTALERVASRRFTSSAPLHATQPGPNGAVVVGQMVGYDGLHLWQNVIGFRHWHVMRNATWEFWYQTVAVDPAGPGGHRATARLLCRL